MSSILDLEADCSSDENDGDYVPPSGVIASDSSGEDEVSLDEDEESDLKPKSRKGKRSSKKIEKPEPEVVPSVDPVDQKKRAESIWLDFLSDVSKNSPAPKKTNAPESEQVPKVSELKNEISKPLSTEPVKESKPEVFEFAGETFTVSNESVKSSESPQSSVVETVSPETHSETPSGTSAALPKKRGGIESILGSISNKKKKLSTLEKTLYDWKSFKKDEGLYEELEQYNKGKGGFIQRQRFLERSDLRSFEIEKSMRQSKRKM